jgi:hypothetical protein
MIDYKLEHIFSFRGIAGGPPEVIGPVPEGIRVNFVLTGGEVTGPRVRGKVRPVGGDWMTVRKDGVATVDVRATFETHDGALILITYPGVIDFGNGGYEQFQRGELPELARIRIAPRLSTSHPDYLWLNRLQCLGIGEYRQATHDATYDVYAVR